MVCVLDASGTGEAFCFRKLVSGRKVAGTIRSVINVRGLQLECVRMLHEALLVPFLLYSSETMIWRENERSKIRTVQIDNLQRVFWY